MGKSEPGLRGPQEGVCGIPDAGAVYSEQICADDQEAFAARRTGSDAGEESVVLGEAGHQNETASDGAFFCERDVVWF
jgi:hypothetical protein